MAVAIIDGIRTRYEVHGDGPPLLMFSPGGFDATLEKWSTQGIYAKTNMLAHLKQRFSCIIFDRRETGQSGGRVERVTWSHYVAQGKGLLDHLGISRAHLMGGCMGCCPTALFAVMHPDAALSQTLIWPVGGAKYRIVGHQRFADHLAFVRQEGLKAVIELAKRDRKSFGAEARGGPWVSVINSNPDFAERYLTQDLEIYRLAVTGMARSLFDRDTAPGAEPEDLLTLALPTLIVPGSDASHATSAARYLEECIPNSAYWDVSVDGQTEETMSKKLLAFLDLT